MLDAQSTTISAKGKYQEFTDWSLSSIFPLPDSKTSRRVREGVFFRSARLDDATSEDRKVIRQDIGIKTVIDLRTK